MTFPIGATDERGCEAGIACIREYCLGGRHHGERDRVATDHILVCAPQLPYLIRQIRMMQQRMGCYLIRHGVRQFLGFDFGVPTMGHLHEVALSLLSDALVVYVDDDLSVVRTGQSPLEGHDHAAYLHVDVRCVDHVLSHPDMRGLIDLREPVGLMMIDTLLHVPAEDNADPLITPYIDAVCSGSYLGLSQFSKTQRASMSVSVSAEIPGDIRISKGYSMGTPALGAIIARW